MSAAPERSSRRRRLGMALAITLGFLVIEAAGGILSGSLALLADAAHLFTDAAALILAYAAVSLSERTPTKRYSFGFYRGEILPAFVNAEILLLVSAFIFYEAYRRFFEPPAVKSGLMLVVAVAGLAANLLAMRILHGHDEKQSLNLQAAYLEVLTDALGSIAVIAGAIVISFTAWYWVDPVISAGIGLLIVPRTLSILKQSAHILLEGTPGEIDLPALRKTLSEIPGVEAVHDLHFWTLTSDLHSASIHVRSASGSAPGDLLAVVQQRVKELTGVDHVTVQVELAEGAPCEAAKEHE